MKKILLLVGLLLIFSSCQTMWHYNIGQTWSEFAKMNGTKVNRLNLESQTQERAVYSFGNTGYSGSNPLFFYFENGRLVQVDRGEARPDLNIKIQH